MIAVFLLLMVAVRAPGRTTNPTSSTNPTNPTAATTADRGAPTQGRTVTVYGAAGTFRGLTPDVHATPTGQDLEAVAVPGWGFEPGASAFFASITDGGRVVFGTVPQTDNQAQSTGSTMSVGVLDPAGPTFASLRIPTSAGATSVTMPGGVVGGADVSDLCAITTPAGPRTIGVSALPYQYWDTARFGQWPALVALRDDPARAGADAVTFDAAASRTAEQLRDTPAGAQAFPIATNGTVTFVPSHGLVECDVTPRGLVVASQYFFDASRGATSGSLVAFAPDGHVVAHLSLPPAALQRAMTMTRTDGTRVSVPSGTTLELSPREVRADPHTAAADDQRFVVVYDAAVVDPERSGQTIVTAFSLQELRLDETAGTIEPTSDPIVTTDPARGTGDDAVLRANTTVYAPDGTLFVTRNAPNGMASLLAAPVAVFRPGSLAGRASQPAAWGRIVTPDAELASTAGGRVPLTTSRSIDFDVATSTVLMVGSYDARLHAFRWNGWDDARAGAHARPETTYCEVDLGGALLVDPAGRERLQIRQGVIDPVHHRYIVPFQGLQPVDDPRPNEVLPQYAFAVDLDRVLGPDDEVGGGCAGDRGGQDQPGHT